MRTNTTTQRASPRTHEGGLAARASPVKELRRAVMARMLFEGTFYENGEDAAQRMSALIKAVSFEEAAQIAIEAREKMKLRHVPLFMVREMLALHKGRKMGDLITRVIQRADECAELLALYWTHTSVTPVQDDVPTHRRVPGSHKTAHRKIPLAAQLKVGLARALKKFSEYELAKHDLNGAVRLRDVMMLCRPRARNVEHNALLHKLGGNALAVPDTWEVALSEGADKKATFERLIAQKRLGALALLRNLRGMLAAGVEEDLIRGAIAAMSTERVLPFRFITAARYAPRLEDALERAMFSCLGGIETLPGKTALLIDHSGSMTNRISQKSEVSRFEAGVGLAMILRECAERVRIFAFSRETVEVPPRRGFALAQALRECMPWGGTYLGQAVKHVYEVFPECERLIVLTDEQSADRPQQPKGRGYIVNVAGYQHGIAYGSWVSIDGWSEAIVDYVRLSAAEESSA